MKIFVIVAFLGIALAQDCPAYVKKGCLKKNRSIYHTQVANNRDSNSNVFTGTSINWNNYQQSLIELGCACANKVKELGGVGFAMGFYGECWMATDKTALEASLTDPNQQSSKCIGHDYKTCTDSSEHCMGGADSLYIYGFPSAAPAPIDGKPGQWSEWTPCSATCGEGFSERERSCNSPVASNGGRDCSDDELTETKTCKIVDCPVDGKWSDWSDYETCPVTCGGSSQKRTRKCDNPAPAFGGVPCPGSDEESKSCGTAPCPINGKWAQWSSYGSCSKSCGGGQKSRSRSCSNPAPKYNGAACPGSSSQTASCNTQNCPINGNWAQWSLYGSCSKSCGGGQKSRSRSCSNPAPKYNGAACPGSSSQTSSCNTQNCPIDAKWGSWGSYGSCSKTCHYGTQTRSRSCSGAKYNGKKTCPGSSTSTRNCNVNKRCPYWTGDKTVRVCEGSSKVIECSDRNQVIKLQDYYWGRTSKSHCRSGVDWLWSTSCRGGHGRIANRCHNRNKCTLEANNNWMNDDPCWGTPKYAYIKYKCYG